MQAVDGIKQHDYEKAVRCRIQVCCICWGGVGLAPGRDEGITGHDQRRALKYPRTFKSCMYVANWKLWMEPSYPGNCMSLVDKSTYVHQTTQFIWLYSISTERRELAATLSPMVRRSGRPKRRLSSGYQTQMLNKQLGKASSRKDSAIPDTDLIMNCKKVRQKALRWSSLQTVCWTRWKIPVADADATADAVVTSGITVRWVSCRETW